MLVSYAQNFEDVLLNRIFESRESGFYIDVGAYDPAEISVTKYFYNLGWNGINLEPVESCFKNFVQDRKRDINLQLGASNRKQEISLFRVKEEPDFSSLDEESVKELADKFGWTLNKSTIKVDTLTNIYQEYASGKNVDFLKIDVEGWEQHVIEGIDFNILRPMVLLIESTPPGFGKVKQWSKLREIDSWSAWEPRILKAGYSFLYFDGLNRYYIVEEEAAKYKERFSYHPSPILDGFVHLKGMDHQYEKMFSSMEGLHSHLREKVAKFENEIAKLRPYNTYAKKKIDKLNTEIIKLKNRSISQARMLQKLTAENTDLKERNFRLDNRLNDIVDVVQEKSHKRSPTESYLSPDIGKNSYWKLLENELLSHDVNLIPSLELALHNREELPDNWVAFSHMPLHLPQWYSDIPEMHAISMKFLANTHSWDKNKDRNGTFFTFSDYHAEKFSQIYKYDVQSVRYPLPPTVNKWQWKAFKKNTSKQLIQLGWWMQRMVAIRLVPESQVFEKIWQHSVHGPKMQILESEKQYLKSKNVYFEFMSDSVSDCDYSRKLDLSQNVVFLHYYDIVSPQIVLRCISQHVPFLVNAIPAIVEYVGDKYPLYYQDYREALAKAEDFDLVHKAHKYLKNLAGEKSFQREFFISEVLKKLGK